MQLESPTSDIWPGYAKARDWIVPMAVHGAANVRPLCPPSDGTYPKPAVKGPVGLSAGEC